MEMLNTPNLTRSDKIGSTSKLERFKWDILHERGEFLEIDKDELRVDHLYQRDKLNEKRINDIASHFDWVRFGCLSVALRSNENQYVIMDGQHRYLAALKRSDIKKLPCMVFEIESVALEAFNFVQLNSQKTAVSGVDRFKALIISEDESAVALSKIIHSTGHRVGVTSGAKVVSCVMCLWRYYRRDRDVFKDLWPLLSDMTPVSSIIDCVFRGVWGAEIKARGVKTSLLQHPYREILLSLGGTALAADIRRETAIYGKGGERVETIAVIKAINKRRIGKYRLPVD